MIIEFSFSESKDLSQFFPSLKSGALVEKLIFDNEKKVLKLLIETENNPDLLAQLEKEILTVIPEIELEIEDKTNIRVPISLRGEDVFQFLKKHSPDLLPIGLKEEDLVIRDNFLIFKLSGFQHKFLTQKEDLLRRVLMPYLSRNGVKDFQLERANGKGKLNLHIGKKVEFDPQLLNNVKKTTTTSNKPYYYQNQSKKKKKEKKELPKGVLYGYKIKDSAIPISQIDEDFSGTAVIEGRVFHIEKDVIFGENKDRGVFSFYLTDEKDAIAAIVFYEIEDWSPSVIKVGSYLKLKGKVDFSSYSNEQEITVRAINLIEKEEEEVGEEKEKRVEFHLHTKMSALDGMIDLDKLFESAKKIGLSSFAVTDHGVLQAYPQLMSLSKKHNYPVVYGVEGYLVKRERGKLFWQGSCDLGELKDKTMGELEYVVFDLETTGFSPRDCQIIEIGAIKVKDLSIVDRFSCFVKLEEGRVLPEKIISLTGITPQDLMRGLSEEEALLKFREFSQGAILVAHNAEFDFNFINYRLNYWRNEKFSNYCLDTLRLSQYILPENKKFGLKELSKFFKVPLEHHHRAVDDAGATYLVLRELLKKGWENKKLKEVIDIVLDDFRRIKPYHIVVLVKNQAGIKDLYELVSCAHIEYFFKRPLFPDDVFESIYQRGNLLAGTACVEGELIQSYLRGAAEEELKSIIQNYDYVELQPRSNNFFLYRKGTFNFPESIEKMNLYLYQLAKKMGKPVIATSDSHILEEKDNELRKILLAGQGFSDADETEPLPVWRTSQLLEEFSYLGEEVAREIVINNTLKLKEEISEEILPIPPDFCPPIIDGADEEIRNLSYNKVKEIYGDNPPELIQKRLERELNSIINNGFAVLYLIAHKLVKKSNEDGYLVGSRGSVGSSLVAWAMDITEVNPLPPHYLCPQCKKVEFSNEAPTGLDLPEKECGECQIKMERVGFDIPFEVFMGFEGDKTPDIDLNFSGEYQHVIHKYTEELFGKDFVFRAGTISTLSNNLTWGFVKKYFEERNIQRRKAYIQLLSMKMLGVRNTTGQHPGGLMVVPRDKSIYDFTPIQYPANRKESGSLTTHFDYHSIHDNLVKLDLLGHDNPTFIKEIEELSGFKIPLEYLNDKKMLSIFNGNRALDFDQSRGPIPDFLEGSGTLGIPEFGTNFVRGVLQQTNPTTVDELVKISGLSHGTDVWLNNGQDLVKSGTATLKEIICARDDIMNFLIEKGLPPKEAFTIMERVRKGKGLTDEQLVLMRENNIPEWYIESCQKIKYMFPKAHAVAYVLMSLRIAYYKVYYPAEFYTILFYLKRDSFNSIIISKGLTSVLKRRAEILQKKQISKITKTEENEMALLEIVAEAYYRGIKFLPVNIEESDATKFKLYKEQKAILPPFSTVPGLGDSVAKKIILERERAPFSSISDFKSRTSCNQTVIELLKGEGVFKGWEEDDQISLFS